MCAELRMGHAGLGRIVVSARRGTRTWCILCLAATWNVCECNHVSCLRSATRQIIIIGATVRSTDASRSCECVLDSCAVCERTTQHCLCNDVWWVRPWLVSSSSFTLNELFKRRALFTFGQIERFWFSCVWVSVSMWMCTCHYCLYPFDSETLSR